MKNKFTFFDEISVLSVENSNHEFPIHSHETFCISVITKGTFGENELMAASGTILISHPDELHFNSLVNNNLYDMKTFFINKDVLTYSSGSKDICFANKIIDSPKLYNYFNQLPVLENRESNDSSFEKIMQNGLNELVNNHGCSSPYEPTIFDSALAEVKLYILEHIDEKITLLNLARIVNMDKYKFIRWFKKNAGLTPFEFIIMTRIELAKKMINNGKPIINVALDSGFYDQSNFSNYFKRFVGISPKKYSTSYNIFQELD